MHAEHGVAVNRAAPARTPASAAVRGLLAGPTAAERRRGLSSTVPSGSRLLGLTVKDGLATVDLSSRFASGGGSASMNARLAQLVYTLTAVAGVERVNLHLEGRLVRVFSSEGLLLYQPLRRSDYAEFIP
ncbi:MAG TPA: GerMN domain-containing protein [Gaiellaceae bacterium]